MMNVPPLLVLMSPATSSLVPGFIVPIPTLPTLSIVISGVPAEFLKVNVWYLRFVFLISALVHNVAPITPYGVYIS